MKDKVYQNIVDERFFQDQKWGHSHDDSESEANWIKYINHYANRDGKDFRTRMVQVAALAVAAIESYDRKTK